MSDNRRTPIRGRRVWSSALAFLVWCGVSQNSLAADIVLVAAGGIRGAVEEMTPTFEHATGHRIVARYGPGGFVKQHVLRGNDFDVAILQAPSADVLASSNVVAGSATVLATVSIAVAIRAGDVRPDISTSEAVKHLLLSAKSISYPNPRAGADAGLSVESTLERLGITAAVQPKVTYGELKARTVTLLARGTVDVGLTYISEIDEPGIQIVGPLPAGISDPTPLVSVIGSNAKQKRAAVELERFLRSPAAISAYRNSRLVAVVPGDQPD